MKIKIKPGSFLYKVILFFGSIALKIWLFTLRVKVTDPQNINRGDYEGNFIATMWHNRIVGVLPLFHKKIRKRGFAMASRSKDGQVIADILAKFHVRTIRGSANKEGRNKGGAAALIQCINTLKDGYIICIIPDGPRGPKYEVQPGAVVMSAKSGVPIMPVSVNCSSCWEMKSWDRLQIPKPFSKVELVIGEFIHFEGPMEAEKLEGGKETLKQAMMAITVDKS